MGAAEEPVLVVTPQVFRSRMSLTPANSTAGGKRFSQLPPPPLRRRTCFIDPFANVRGSTEHALACTLANLAGKKVAVLRPLSDIDDGASWRRYVQEEVGNAYGRR